MARRWPCRSGSSNIYIGMQEWLVVGRAGVAINSMQEWLVVGRAGVAIDSMQEWLVVSGSSLAVHKYF